MSITEGLVQDLLQEKVSAHGALRRANTSGACPTPMVEHLTCR
jgi:hypothetical protein